MKYPKITIVNIGGAHGHFLRYTLDKFAKHTPQISKDPFGNFGTSHQKLDYSDYFALYDWIGDEHFPFENDNLIVLDIDDQILYYERVWLYRAGESGTDLYSEEEIRKTLAIHGPQFPDKCDEMGVSLKKGYELGFKNLATQGSVVRNQKRINKAIENNNNVFLYSINNFLDADAFKKSIDTIGSTFGIDFDIKGIEELYQKFVENNTLIQTHDNVAKYLAGNKDIELDVIQQAYIDALEN